MEYPIARYTNKTRRICSILEQKLRNSDSGFIVGNKFTIVDIAIWSLVAAAAWAGIDIVEFPLVKAYYERLLTRPSIERGMNAPEIHPVRALVNDQR
jgi:glutathione S-transferase